VENKMKRYLSFLILLFVGLGFFLIAQATDEKDNDAIRETGSVQITNIIIDNFEDAGAWQGKMPRDLGIIRVMSREGGAGPVKDINSNENKFCLGAKIAYFKTGASWFSLAPPREIAVKGLSRELSVWACGRNFNHELQGIVRDYSGELRFTTFGKLNFPGWQKLNAQIPSSIEQENYKLYSSDRLRGIRFVSMLIKCSPDETVGEYYMYLDNLTAKTDIFLENPANLDKDDMRDTW
jgi:Flagellar filament outer layer protein Flaa